MQKNPKITAPTHRCLRSASRNDEFRAFLDLLLATGACPADILALRSKSIRLREKLLTIVPQKGGRAAAGVLILIDRRLERVISRLPKAGKLFPNLNIEKVTREFSRIREECRVTSKITVHSYRSAKLSRLLKGEQ